MDIEEFLTKLETRLTKAETPTQPTTPETPQGISAEDLRTAFSELSTNLTKAVDEKIAANLRAQELQRGEGTGSKAIVTDPMQEDPLNYIVQKCQQDTELTPEEKALAWAFTREFIGNGMAY